MILQGSHRLEVATDHAARHPAGVLRPEQRQHVGRHRRQLAMLLDLRRPAGREDEVADTLAGFEHRHDQAGGEVRGEPFGNLSEERGSVHDRRGSGHVGTIGRRLSCEYGGRCVTRAAHVVSHLDAAVRRI
jgi:hypothetical protein